MKERKPQKRYQSWLTQASNDLRWGRDSLKTGHFAQTCFVAQQVAEKALKALAFFRGFDMVKSHSILSISKDLGLNGEIVKAARILDLYYISARYPDALPDSAVPSEQFDKKQAEEAMRLAGAVLRKVKKELA